MKLPFRSSDTPFGPRGSKPAAGAGAGMPDGELAKAAQCGDKRAFVEIVARHQALVCGVAYGILGDFAASEDAAQEAFLTAWRRIHDLRDPGQLRPWLCRIVRNAALGHLRRRHPERSLDEALDAADPSLHPDEAAASGEEAALVHDALTKLPETFRMPLILFYREGQSVKSVAEALELSEDAVKQRLSRGREMLRERMSGLIEDVLTRTRPTAVFTMLIAGAIGALTAPSVVAGTAFAAAATSSAVSSTTSTAVTAMSTSKTTLVTAALVAAACLPLGYGARLSLEPASNLHATVAAAPEKAAGDPLRKSDLSKSALYAEWQRLHKEHGSDAAAMPALYKAISDIKDPVRRRVFRAAQIAEWAEVAPAAGLAYFLEKGRDAAQRNQFFDEWMRRDAAAAVDALIASGTAGDGLARRSLTEIARRVPGKLAEVVSRLPRPESYWAHEVQDAFALFAGSGGVGAARAAAEALTGGNREAALSGLAKAWAKTDPDGAIAWARALPDGTDRDEIIRYALTGLAAVNPRAALDRISSVPPGGRDGYFATTTGARVLREAAAADYDATITWLKQHPLVNHEDMMGIAGAVTDRINADPRAFLDKHAADGSLAALLPAVSSALLNDAAGQSHAVWEWIKARPGDEALQGLRQQVMNAVAYQNPFEALKLAADFPAGAAGETDIRMLTAGVLNGGQRMGMFDQLYAATPENMREALVDTAILHLNPDNMDDPQRWLTRAAAAPKGLEASWTSRIVSAWAGKAPDEAAAWAAALPEGEVRTATLPVAAAAWIEKDPYGASAWMDRLPAGAEKDQAASTLVQNIARDAPSEAWEWAMAISDPALRANSASRVLEVVAKRDPQQALEWLDSSQLPADRKSQLGEYIRQGAAFPQSQGGTNNLPPSGANPARR